MPRHRHDRAGAVLHEDVVRDPDGDELAGRGVRRVRPGELARLLLRRLAAHDVLLGGARAILRDDALLLRRRDRVDQRMLGREDQVGRPEDGVGARREDLDHGLVDARLRCDRDGRAPGVGEGVEHAEAEPCAIGTPDPVPLRLLRRLRPVEPLEVAEEPCRVVGDLEEPLLEEALLDHGAATVAGAALDLLVGEHGLARRAPVDRGGLLVREPLLVELQEDPLRPLVVGRVGRVDRLRPVHHEAGAVELAAEVRDVAGDQLHRVAPDLQREILRVDAERVIAERLEHRVALQALESRIDITAGEGEEVPDVQPFGRRIREHHQRIERRLAARDVRPVGLALGPALAPARFDGRRLVADRFNGCCHVCGWESEQSIRPARGHQTG